MTLQRGAANIAVRCSSDLRIVTIKCSEQMLNKESQWYDVPSVKPVFLPFQYTSGLRSTNFTTQIHKNRRWPQGS